MDIFVISMGMKKTTIKTIYVNARIKLPPKMAKSFERICKKTSTNPNQAISTIVKEFILGGHSLRWLE